MAMVMNTLFDQKHNFRSRSRLPLEGTCSVESSRNTSDVVFVSTCGSLASVLLEGAPCMISRLAT
jgi:hypothetical protein